MPIKLFFVALLSLIPIGVFGQRYNFANYSVEEGLPQSQIYSICEDSKGYIWFGTFGGGLTRFDGIDLVTYNEEQGLDCNFIRSIVEVDNGTLLIGTDEGLDIMVRDKFIHYKRPDIKEKVAVRSIVIDQQKNIWVGTIDHGLFQYKEGVLKHYTIDEGLLSNSVSCLYADNTGNIWVGHDNGFCRIGKEGVKAYHEIDGRPFIAIRGITGDKNGRIWFASYLNGAAVYNGLSFKRITGLPNSTVYTVFADKKGNMWFGTAAGLTRLQKNNFKTITADEGLCSNTIVTILEDSDHSLWFGSSGGGVSRFDSEKFIHFPENEKMGKLVYDIQPDNEGNMWFATSSGGVTKFDGTEYTVYNEESGFTSGKIKAIYCTPENTFWFGSNGNGAYYYDGKSFEHYTYKTGLCGSFISGITADKYGNIWFSSLDKGVGFYNPRNKNFYRYRKTDGLASDRVNSLCADTSGNIWVGTANAGINRLSFSEDTTTVTISTINQSNGLTRNNINSLVFKNNKLYIGTSGGGINIMAPSGKITTWEKKQGLGSNIVYSLIFDESGNLWSGTEKGIDKIIFKNDSVLRVVHSGKADGFVGVENTLNSSCKDSVGNLWFGTINGANMYNPNFDQDDVSPPRIMLTGVNILFDKIEDTEYGTHVSSFEELSEHLILPYYKNHLSFDFTSINFRNPDAIKYQWKLEGDDENWSPVLSRREVTYSNLPPGKYTFLVKACNANGVWSTQPASFSFKITAPYWTSLWFIISLIGLAVLILSIVVYSTVKRIRSKNRDEKQRLEMSKNILELQQATSRLQMNPHFIFNSLNSIQGYIASNNTTEAKWYLSKFAKLMRLILDNAKEEFIPLKDEIYILENYLILEQMRIAEKFEYTLNFDESIDIDAVEVPPMIFQPFVENAILHGFRHKEGKGFLSIVFSMKDEMLVCEITDNGIGRQAATELKNKSAAGHKTSAILITEERLKAFGKESKKQASISILDLKDVEGKGCGTKVIIQIPI